MLTDHAYKGGHSKPPDHQHGRDREFQGCGEGLDGDSEHSVRSAECQCRAGGKNIHWPHISVATLVTQ